MVRSKDVGWIVIMEVGWHETTLDDAPEPHTHFLPFFLYNWLIPAGQLDCTARGEFWATNAPNATPVLTHR